MSLPIFQGVSYDRINDVVGTSRLSFQKYAPGQIILGQGDVCGGFKFIISGKVRVTIHNRNRRFAVSQTLEAPSSLGSEFLFGRSTLFPGEAVAMDETVSIMEMDKNDFVRLLHTDDVFLFNYLNELATTAQQSVRGVMSFTAGSLEERLAFWILSLTQRDAKDVTLTCKQRDLYAIFGVQRSSFIATMQSLTQQGVIVYQPGEVHVPSRRALEEILES